MVISEADTHDRRDGKERLLTSWQPKAWQEGSSEQAYIFLGLYPSDPPPTRLHNTLNQQTHQDESTGIDSTLI